MLTRHWTGNENSWNDYLLPNDSPVSNETHPDYSVIYLPSAKSRLNVLLERTGHLLNSSAMSIFNAGYAGSL